MHGKLPQWGDLFCQSVSLSGHIWRIKYSQELKCICDVTVSQEHLDYQLGNISSQLQTEQNYILWFSSDQEKFWHNGKSKLWGFHQHNKFHELSQDMLSRGQYLYFCAVSAAVLLVLQAQLDKVTWDLLPHRSTFETDDDMKAWFTPSYIKRVQNKGRCPALRFTTSARDFFHKNKCRLCPHWYKLRQFFSVKCNLTKVPHNIPARTTRIRLEYNKINHIFAGTFSNLSKCTHLFLPRNNIFVLEPGSFKGLLHLKEVFLYKNRLSVIHTGIFNHLAQCMKLNLYDNMISCIEKGAFTGLTSLTELFLSKNRISLIEEGLFDGLSYLEILSLSYNAISFIERGSFKDLKKLKKIFLRNNKISVVETGIFNHLSQCEVLYLENNKVFRVTKYAFNGMLSLKELHFNRNSLFIVDLESLTGLRKLEKLHLGENSVFLNRSGVLQHLFPWVSLNLSNNNISSIAPESFTGMVSFSACIWIRTELVFLKTELLQGWKDFSYWTLLST